MLARQVISPDTHLSWETLAAIPETFLTAWGSLDAIEIESGQTLVLRGATSSLGLAALSLAREKGVRVIATRGIVPGGVNGVLELVGVTSLRDSLKAVAPRGVVCNSESLGHSWIFDRFEPLVDIPY